jgi:hypothetical protein
VQLTSLLQLPGGGEDYHLSPPPETFHFITALILRRVDDDEDSRLMLIALLRLALIEAKAFGTAAKALSSIQTERFDKYLDGRLVAMRRVKQFM